MDEEINPSSAASNDGDPSLDDGESLEDERDAQIAALDRNLFIAIPHAPTPSLASPVLRQSSALMNQILNATPPGERIQLRLRRINNGLKTTFHLVVEDPLLGQIQVMAATKHRTGAKYSITETSMDEVIGYVKYVISNQILITRHILHHPPFQIRNSSRGV